MESPERPHVRLYHGEIFVERVPNYWVIVCSIEDWLAVDEPDRRFLCSRARKLGKEFELPAESEDTP